MGSQSSAHFNLIIFCYSKNTDETLPFEKIFKVPNVDKVIEDGKKTATKFRNIKLHRIPDAPLPTDIFTATGWPSVSGDALKSLAGKVSADYDFMNEDLQLDGNIENASENEVSEKQKSTVDADKSAYGLAFQAFENKEEGREACHAISALCEVCSIDSLISNFILPLQVIAATMSFWYWSSYYLHTKCTGCLCIDIIYIHSIVIDVRSMNTDTDRDTAT
jgi:hypothetical protein